MHRRLQFAVIATVSLRGLGCITDGIKQAAECLINPALTSAATRNFLMPECRVSQGLRNRRAVDLILMVAVPLIYKDD